MPPRTTLRPGLVDCHVLHTYFVFRFPTEFRVEIYTPPYLSGVSVTNRPTNVTLSSTSLIPDGSNFTVSYTAPITGAGASVVLYYGGFVTHSLHMGARMAVLDVFGFQRNATSQRLTTTMPPSSNVVPPGPYVVYVLQDGVPGVGQFVSVGRGGA